MSRAAGVGFLDRGDFVTVGRLRGSLRPSIKASEETEHRCKLERLYDAVVGRHILIHTPDPVALISRAQSFVHPGGILAFQEYDLSF